MSEMTEGFMAIESELQKRRRHEEVMKGKTTEYRVEFRFRRGSKRWMYFEKLEDCKNATSKRCSYNIFGSPLIESPTSKQIQKMGPRGGWRKIA